MTTLHVRDLVKEYRLRSGPRRSTLRAADRVSLTLRPGRTVALVGESGSGKSTVARIIARLERPTGGEIEAVDAKGRRIRDRDYRHHVQMVFQDPFASLNPFHTIEHHLVRPLRLHGRARDRESGRTMAGELLERVNLTPAADIAGRRPHELSGGQRQRVAIARALAPGARVVIADEPVSMLDVSIRLGVLNLLARLQREEDLAVLYITHDLATARHFSDDILVMYRGRVVERGPADDVILAPAHPYTRLLASAAPDPEARGRSRQITVPESAGSPTALSGRGCHFRDRCPSAMEICSRTPEPVEVAPDHAAACWLHTPESGDGTGTAPGGAPTGGAGRPAGADPDPEAPAVGRGAGGRAGSTDTGTDPGTGGDSDTGGE
ncbi:ABC transporter ATP-binding protein [Streptomyces sp. ST2-7A]|uniref:ABC transporter ATP-binding protein n=1 Tax=Streptomyces sp. ST2-7A TaxID=2907214 RepID=UPI001F216332|nr:ABC transporter ATP-binding protein [Streptomyces sp. ST2-7A]MCE7083092.1 ABC transporter ATP-binding protein [Streptomyces sp. ST2-7A]